MTTMTETREHVDLDARQEALERRVLLLCPTIGWWKGMYQLSGRDTEVKSEGKAVNKEDVTTPRAKLITDTYPLDASGIAWKKRFQKIDSRLDALKNRFSVPFPIQGVRVVPKARGQELMDELYGLTIGRLRRRIETCRNMGDQSGAYHAQHALDEALKREGADAPNNTPVFDTTKDPDGQSIAYDLHMAASEFCNNWAAIRAEIARKNDVFKLVESKVPTSAGMIRTKFHLDVVPVELAGGITDSTEVTQDDLAEHNDVVRDACRRRVEEAIEEMIEGPRMQLAEALASLKDLIARDGRVTQKSFKPIREAISKIRMFDFVASPAMMAQIKQLEDRLDITQPNSLDSVTAANNGFSAAIDGFMNEVQDAERNAQDLRDFGREHRAIDLD